LFFEDEDDDFDLDPFAFPFPFPSILISIPPPIENPPFLFPSPSTLIFPLFFASDLPLADFLVSPL